MVEVKIENIFVGFHAFRTFALFRIVKWTGFAKGRKRIPWVWSWLPKEIGWESDGNWRKAPC